MPPTFPAPPLAAAAILLWCIFSWFRTSPVDEHGALLARAPLASFAITAPPTAAPTRAPASATATPMAPAWLRARLNCTASAFFGGLRAMGAPSAAAACPPWSRADALACLRDEHVFVFGDSVFRFAHSSLTNLLAAGAWAPAELVRPMPARADQKAHTRDDWTTSFGAIVTAASVNASAEVCDCFRDVTAFGAPANRYWFGPPGSRVRISYSQWWANDFSVGHSADALGLGCFADVVAGTAAAVTAACAQRGCTPGLCGPPYDWVLGTNSTDRLVRAVLERVLRVAPTVLVFNSHAHASYDSDDGARTIASVVAAVQHAHPALRIMWFVSYPTRGEQPFPRDAKIVAAIRNVSARVEFVDGSRVFDAHARAGPLDWNELFYDNVHPSAPVYAAGNEALLWQLCAARYHPDAWALLP